ncbi:DUF5348 domain-containing protein [Paenibacillus cremeus]|uniref:DUF5348 domain-containing protein n=1 Tax=Paenibacillus cremeus TaxID=2163881 RepID=A0A559K4Z6_9BACL|nr:DUF5348 domain-containing protein [Paenibacillus cremeus]TVY07204.1 hypothetical protein FPZ49_25180 [Paenibacillus cremeus]
MIGQWNKMTYDRDAACWVVQLVGGVYGLHCGEFMEIRVGDRGIPCRLELDRDWYVVMREACFYLRKKDYYQVKI